MGILYDGGSSTSRTFSKVKPLKREFFDAFITTKTKSSLIDEELLDMANESVDYNTSNTFKDPQDYLKIFTDKKEIKVRKKKKFVKNVADSEKKDDIERISDVLENSNLEYIFLFLSHPDEDHINYIEHIIPDESILVSFLGGNWFNHDTEDSVNVISYLTQRDKEKTFTFYPYYWEITNYFNSKTKKIENLEYNNLVKWYEKLAIESTTSYKKIEGLKEKYSFPALEEGSYTHSNPFSGYLYQLLFDKLNLPIKSDKITDAIKNTYIWSLNHYAKDVNEQSIVISCTLPSLGMNFFCTGDAGESTFSHISVYHNLMKITPTYNGFINTVILPHHGSINNQSLTMLKLYNPHILISSAGYGTHDHPDKYIHDIYQQLLPQASQELQKRFMLNKIEADEIVFFDKESGTAYLKQYNYGEPLILGTNICGDIKFDENGIARKYYPYLSLGNSKYKPDISKSIFSTVNKSLNKSGIDFTVNKDIILYKNKLYYVVSDKKDTWIYDLKEII